jgi:hypothetical protein
LRYLSVKNFDRFQHYKDRSTFSWIKLYASLLHDDAFGLLPDKSKAHLMLIWLVVSQRHDRRIPDDPKWVAAKIGATDKVDLKILIENGWLISLDLPYQTKETPVHNPSILSLFSLCSDLSSLSALELWFWGVFRHVYPEHRQVQAKTAVARLKESNPDEAERARILGVLELWKQSAEWTRDEGKYVPGMGRFFADGWHTRQPRAAPAGPRLSPSRQQLFESIQREKVKEANGKITSSTNPAESQRHLDPPANGRRGTG